MKVFYEYLVPATFVAFLLGVVAGFASISSPIIQTTPILAVAVFVIVFMLIETVFVAGLLLMEKLLQ